MPACPNCGEQNPEKARFCLECGTPLAQATPAAVPVIDEERKLDTLVFVNLVGSTALAESLDPEDVLGLLELYYKRLRAELEHHGGTVEKYIGDAIVTHFGVPVAHEDDPERAVRAALGILDTVKTLNAEDPIRQIEVRIGVATGEVIVQHGNRAEEGKGLAWGDADADADLAALLRDELRGSIEHYETLKARHGALDFLDLLLRARNLVRDDADVRARVPAALHARLRRRVPGHRSAAGGDPAAARRRRSRRSATGPRVRPLPGKLFVVGDPKQSIYRFRRADVGSTAASASSSPRRRAVRCS